MILAYLEVDRKSSKAGQKMSGNPFWRAPEYKLPGQYSKACDIFSYGVLLFERLWGKCLMRRC